MNYYSIGEFAQLVTVFSAKLQGKRSNKTKRMIKELVEDD